jgi:tetratricopeptide (TPR) repeat protein
MIAPGGAGATVTVYTPDQQKGNAAYAARDFAGAVAAYQQAIAASPNDPMGHYLLGEAELAAGNMAEAEAAWNTGIRFVKDKDSLHAKLLFVLADLRERQGKWVDAKQAWTDYAQFVTAHPEAHGYAATATERQARIVAHEDLEAKYVAVRQRIEDRKKELEKPAPDDSPQKAPAKPAPTKKK